jgi:phospho-N-acetylmuramoyl-pentapeptide-transferase
VLYSFLRSLSTSLAGLAVFKYITVRGIFACLTAFLFIIVFAPYFIKWLSRFQIFQNTRGQECPQLLSFHQQKAGTLTMGGILINTSIIFSTFLWSDLANTYILLSCAVVVYLGAIGLLDDYLKLKSKSSRGLYKRTKFSLQFILALTVASILYASPQFDKGLTVPFMKNAAITLGLFYIPFAALVIIGSTNAVNLTDGLDGLAIGCVIMIAGAFGVLSYVSGHIDFAKYLSVPYVAGAGELAVFCASIVGAGLGFLWFNCYPASIFMGDTGALSLGGAIGAVSLFIKKELFLLLAGGIFVAEAVSVILQVAAFRLKGRRIFKVAPLHHHLQLLGWKEAKVTIRLWIAAAVLAILSLATLRLR